ncbi:hypothetical protein E9993_13855 [Labilibacter sediminis]|nr:hypothetical protein E9993_13855 [Labilibacter sediminis]
MIYLIIAISIGIIASIFLMHKPLIRIVAERKAIPKIESLLFRSKELNKTNVLDIIHELTNNRLSDELVMDYFYKIKGLQVLNNKPINFWVKMYLTTPTKVKLNYFEQVKFYETFLNFPRISEVNNNELENRRNQIRLRYFRTNAKKQLAKNAV